MHLQWDNSYVEEISRGYKTLCQFDREIIYHKMLINDRWGLSNMLLPEDYKKLKLQIVPIAVIRDENIDKILNDEMD